MKPRTLTFLTVVVAAVSSASADAWRDVTVKDGLPNNEIQFLKQDESGAIWIGTNGGGVTSFAARCTA